MAGFLASLFGAGKAGADSDPNPGIGGYDEGTRIDGTPPGYPGSTSANRLNPRTGYKNQRKGLPYQTVGEQQVARQDTAGEYHGGLPYDGALSATYVGPQYQDTEKRPNPNTISTNIPGGLRQRNTVYYGGVQARPDGTNRYVFGGPNGGTDIMRNILTERRMPYTGHGTATGSRSLRGAVLDGTRFNSAPPILQSQGGSYGKSRRHQRHRPTVFVEPAPWSSNFYDTTADTGSPDSPGNPPMVQNVNVSPTVSRQAPANTSRRASHGRRRG